MAAHDNPGGQESVPVTTVRNSLPELALALDLASVGLDVTVLDADETELPESYVPDPDCVLSDWIEFVARPLTETEAPAFFTETKELETEFVLLDGSWKELPQGNVYGIPPYPLHKNVVDAIGFGSSFWAYLDRLKPVLTIGKTRILADLVQKRFGKAVLKSFVDPLTFFIHGEKADRLEVAEVLPGLNEAVTRAGSLSGAVHGYEERYSMLRREVKPHTGWGPFFQALKQKLQAYGVVFAEETNGEEISAVETKDSRIRTEATFLLKSVTGFSEIKNAAGYALIEDEAGDTWGFRVTREDDAFKVVARSGFVAAGDAPAVEHVEQALILSNLSAEAPVKVRSETIRENSGMAENVELLRKEAVVMRRELLNLTQK